jgi:acetyl-CoA carboxylase biotin carboxyl carrier protein
MSKLQVNEDAVRRLAELLEEMKLSEIEYESGGERIRIAKPAVATIAPTAPAPSQAAASPSGTPHGSMPPRVEEAMPAGAITSPMVGTVYVAAEPNAPPFVQIGDVVQEGQTLLIIEAMKVMNPMPSPRAGKVTQILVDNGDPVEYGEPLMVID